MITLPGYHITEQIYESYRTLVYRGCRLSDQKPVIIKVLKHEYPTFADFVKFRNQYTLTRDLNLPGIIPPIALKPLGNTYGLIMEDKHCISLSRLIYDPPQDGKFSLTIETFLNLAIQLTEILEGLRQHQIIHQDIKPQNILINLEEQRVFLIDFSIATQVKSGQTPALIKPVEGTWAYMSPEQTGRVNQTIDYRSDLYSLGITFYEMLTQSLPFSSKDPLELVHAHLVHQPRPPRELNANIPPLVNDIILRLMAKKPEDRYQTPGGLNYDLKWGLQQYLNQGKIELFSLGSRDGLPANSCQNHLGKIRKTAIKKTGKSEFYRNFCQQELWQQERHIFQGDIFYSSLNSEENNLHHQLILNLLGQSENPRHLIGYLYDQTQRLPQLDPHIDEDEFCYLYSHQSFLTYLLEEFEQAAELISEISASFILKQPPINAAYLLWLNSLIHLAIYPQYSLAVQTQIWQSIQQNKRKIRHRAKSGYPYFLTKLKLIEAECYRVQNKHSKALDAYDQAIEYAQADSLFLDLGMACELAGKFYLNWGKDKIASVYFTDAYYAYSHWGAQIKVDHLETHYSQYLLPILYQKTPENTPLEGLDSGTETVTSTHNSQPGVLDLETIMKASQVLSEHLHLPQLISTLIQVILENAGAETCVLILRKQEQFVIESVARSQNNTLCVTSFLESKPWETETKIPQLLIQSVIDNKVPIIIDDVRRQIQRLPYENEAIPSYWHDPYWQTPGLQSILCTPIQYQGQLIGVLYLENNLMAGVFTPDRLGILQFLCSQAAISLENAQLYEKLENYSQDLAQTVAEQTQALRQEIYERKLLEEKLRSSENKMRASFEAMNDIILVLDSEASNIEVTPTHATRLNQGDIDLVSRTVEQFFLEDSSIWLGKVQEALTTNQIINFDYYLNINHECLWFSANISPLPDQTVMWVARDITDRKQAEEGIRHSEEKFASAFRASPSPMTITSLATGQHLEVNDSFLEIMGYEQEEVIGKTALELNFWVNFSDRNRLFELLQTEGMIRNYEFEFRTKSGTIRTALLSAEVVRIQDQECLLSISNDITERKQREEAIRLIAEGTASQTGDDFFRAFVRHLAAALQVKYAVITQWSNPEKTRVKTLAMWRGDRWEEPLEYEVQETPCYGVLKGMKCYYSDQLQSHFPEDKFLQKLAIESYCGMPIFDTNGQVLGHVAVLDVKPMNMNQLAEIILTIFATRAGSELERKQAEDALRESETHLKQALAAADAASQAKSEFLSKMSHELRTPLNAILGFTQVLLRNGSLNTTQQEQIGIIGRSGEHLLSLINDVLEMSKIEAGQITLNAVTFDLYRLLDSIEEMLRIKAESKKLQLIFDQGQDVPQYLYGDEGKLRQVLINLIGNAIKFTEEGGVAVRVDRDLETPPTTPEQVWLQFEIEDTGVGIAAEELDQLFDPFVQTASGRKSQEGTGLGLPISRQFVELMGGDITVVSEVGRGTLFKFAIQVGCASASDIPPSTPRRRVISLAPDQPTYRILVVEDRWESRVLLVNLLSSLGFSVQAAENGQEGVKIWEEWEPHLIWMDMRMPVMDGYAATQAIKSHLKGQATVIIALTASAMEEHRITVLSAGCDDFVRKPFREEVLFDKMAEYLGVQYIYDEEAGAQLNENTSSEPEEVTPATFAKMPASWTEKLYQAAQEADGKAILQLVAESPEIETHLGQTLIVWVNDFRFDKITDVIEQGNHESSFS